MGLMDKFKTQATQIAQEGKARYDQAQANRRGEALLRQLGAAVFAERTGRGGPDSQARIDELVTVISAHERENGLNLTQASVPQPGSPPDEPGASSGTTSGDPSASAEGGGFSQPEQGNVPPSEDPGSGPV